MRKSYLYAAFLAVSMLLMGCSNDEPLTTGGEDVPSSESVTRSYLTLKLVSGATMGTRDENMSGDGQTTKDPAPGEYENGTAKENNVKSIRFFFFDSKGNAAPIKTIGADAYESYIDYYPTSGEGDSGEEGKEDPVISGETVEKVLAVTLGVSIPADYSDEGTKHPHSVLAVINPTSEILSKTVKEGDANVAGPSLETLCGIINNFKTGLDDDNFVMSNSVYVVGEETKTIVNATALSASNFTTTESDSKNPVIIYVERVLARLDLQINISAKAETDDGTVIYKVGSYKLKVKDEVRSNDENEYYEEINKDIYVKLLGWNITSTPNMSRLVKDVYKDWDLFHLGEPWNTADYHRSFWAINPPADTEGFDYLYGNFGTGTDKDESSANANVIPTTVKVPIYLQENAAPAEDFNLATVNPTKVIFAAQLVEYDESTRKAKPIEIAQWGGQQYTLDGVKIAIANNLNLYKKTTQNGGQAVYKKIQPGDLTFKTVPSVDANSSKDDSYYCYAVLDEEQTKGFTWTLGEGEGAEEYKQTEDGKPVVAQVNEYIKERVNKVMVWKEGHTYYYFDIKHLNAIETNDPKANETVGYYGVVRNHIYDATLTKISGLGTPVYDPDETIYPQKPTPEDILDVEVRILQWRVVRHDYDMTW